MLSIPQHQSLYGGACTCLSNLYLPLTMLHPLHPPCPLYSHHSVKLWAPFPSPLPKLQPNLFPCLTVLYLSQRTEAAAKEKFPICPFEFCKLGLFNAEEREEGYMMRGRWEGKCLPEWQEDLPINQRHTPSSCHVNREGLGYQTYWGGQNELMQLTSCFFSTCLPSVGRNWKNCLAKERECNLDYADRSIRAHERAVPLLPMPLFSFLHPSLPSFPLSLPYLSQNGRAVEEGRRQKKMNIYRRGWTQDGVKRQKQTAKYMREKEDLRGGYMGKRTKQVCVSAWQLYEPPGR